MTKLEIYNQYVRRTNNLVKLDEFSRQPIFNIDILETKKEVVNRLYYLTYICNGKDVDVFIFYEENIFNKDKDDLVLVKSK